MTTTLSPQARAEKEYQLSNAIAAASKQWRDAFNRGDAEAAAAMYEEDALMVAKPFGSFKGRKEIQAFWAGIIEQGFSEVVYYKTQTAITDQSLMAAQISADWKMNKAQGIITNELWVMQDNGSALLREDHFEVVE